MIITFAYDPDRQAAADAAGAVVRLAGSDAPGSGGVPDGEDYGLPAPLTEAVGKLYRAGLFKGEPGESQVVQTLGHLKADYVIAAGTGGGAPTQEALRRAGASAARACKRLKIDRVCVLLDRGVLAGTPDCPPLQAGQALAEGLAMGAETRVAKRKEQPAEAALHVTFAPVEPAASADAAARFEEGIRRGELFGRAVAYARRLTNLPGNMLTPEMLALEAEALANETGLEIEVIDEWTAAEQGMGGLLGVGQGSANPPRMIVLEYEGAPDSKEKLGLVGKGITFDTGGISLKRADGMEEMISDMGGAAAVLGAMRIIAELKPAVNVTAVIPAAENMPSDRALKPGDVLTTMSGLTVEVVNTDAEGRLVLADGLTTAIRRGATRLIDVATLTGAVMVALGDVATGAVTNDETFLAELIRVSRSTGERIWQLPSYPEFRKQLDSEAADLKNSGGRYGGTITGGLFIGAFAEERPWIHLDIGGTAWLYKERGWEPKGATGVMTRTLAEYILQLG